MDTPTIGCQIQAKPYKFNIKFPNFLPLPPLSLLHLPHLLPQEEPLRLERDGRVLGGRRRRVQPQVRLPFRHLGQLVLQLIQRRHLRVG